MAQQNTTQSVASLRAITCRISSTPTKQLPHIAAQIAGSLWTCKDLLSTPLQTTKSNSEITTLLHRFKTSLSSLLQDRTIEGRWAAVVLVKATIEAGGVEILSKSGAWIRNLLAILKKPDPPTTRNLTIITLTRIFMLTWDYSNLVREVTTPNLPTFITSCLINVEKYQRCSASELRTVLEAFATLLPRHPTIFRTHEAQIRSLILRILSSSTGSDVHYNQGHTQISQRLLVLLHHCAPKQGSAEKWNETVKATVSSAHETCDRLFRSIVENWRSASGAQQTASASSLSAGEMGLEGPDSLGLTPWKDVFAGGERLITLLGVLQSHLDTATAGPVTVPVGLIVDLSTRLLTITSPSSDRAESMKVNTQIPKDERESMFSILPAIHAATLKLITKMLTRFEISVVSVVQGLLELVLDVFTSEKLYVHVRTMAYEMIQRILKLVGPSMSKEDVADLANMIKACCDELLPINAKQMTGTSNQANSVASKQQLPNTDLSMSSTNVISSHPTELQGLCSSPKSLLIVLFCKINPTHLPRKLRVQMERTAVLTRHREALVACVMNPAKKEAGTATQMSLLPLLASMYPESEEVEALLRPRMPVILSDGDQVAEKLEAFVDDEESVVNEAFDDAAMDIQEDVDGRNEPTYDLLSALEQNDGSMENAGADEEDLYDATPPLPSHRDMTMQKTDSDFESSTDHYSTTKRPAIEPPDESISAKRLRASPVAEALEHEFAGPLPGPDPWSIESSLPVTVAVEQSTAETGSSEHSLQAATFPKHPEAGSVAESSIEQLEQGIGTGENDDDSDLEIPPLNMEPDTDPEDEDGDGDEG